MTPLQTLYDRIDDLSIAMMTTRRRDGHMRARAMATQKAAPGADLWFVTADGSGKLAELSADPHINLAYHRDSNSEWVSVSGVAEISRDRTTINALYQPDWSLWFPKDGADPRHGTADDPRMVLIGVSVHAAEFLAIDAPRPLLLYELAKGWLTGKEPELGEAHALSQPHLPVG